MRFVSNGASAESEGGTVLGVRLGGGDSGGFGCVSVNGSSTDRSLKSNEQRDYQGIYRDVH